MNTTTSDFGVVYEWGQDGLTKDNATHASIWSEGEWVASMLPDGDNWIIFEIDPDYAAFDPEMESDEYESPDELITRIERAVDAL